MSRKQNLGTTLFKLPAAFKAGKENRMDYHSLTNPKILIFC
jgi:hypothetical protein